MSKDPIPWFKFYPDKFMHGVRGLTAQEVGVYQMMLCRIYEENGPVEYHILRLSTYCGMRQNTFKKTVEKLIDLGKLTLKDGCISNDRADTEIASRANDLKISSRGGKVSAEKRQQNQRKSSSEGQAKANHKDEDKDIKELSNDSSKKADAFPTNSDLAEFVREWNSFAKQNDLAQVQKLTDTRKRHLKARLKDCGNLQDVIHILHQTATSAFLMGENKRGWKMDFDFFVTESRFTKIAEGAYDRSTSQPQQSSTNYMAELAAQDFGFAPKQERTDHGQGPIIDGTLQVAKGRS